MRRWYNGGKNTNPRISYVNGFIFFLFFLLLYMREQVESQVLGIKAKMAKFILQEP